MASPFPRLGNGLALVPAQRLDGQPRVPQVVLAIVIDALASALVTPWSGPSTLAAPAVTSSRVSRSGCRRACSCSRSAAGSGMVGNGMAGSYYSQGSTTKSPAYLARL